MTPEWFNAGAALMTLVVVALAAYAALQQMRHLRTGNQTAALLELVREQRDPEYLASRTYVLTMLASDLERPEIRASLATAWAAPTIAALRYVQFYEELGSLVFSGALELGLVLRYFSVADAWLAVEPLVVVLRRTRNANIWEMAEALAMADAAYVAKHGDTWFPAGVSRSEGLDPWLAIDRERDTPRSA